MVICVRGREDVGERVHTCVFACSHWHWCAQVCVLLTHAHVSPPARARIRVHVLACLYVCACACTCLGAHVCVCDGRNASTHLAQKVQEIEGCEVCAVLPVDLDLTKPIRLSIFAVQREGSRLLGVDARLQCRTERMIKTLGTLKEMYEEKDPDSRAMHQASSYILVL